MDILSAIGENVIQGQAAKVKELTQAALDEGIGVAKLLFVLALVEEGG